MKSILRTGAIAGALLCVAAGPARAQEIRRADGECIARNMRVPRDLAPHFPSRLDVSFEVAADGSIDRIQIVPEVASERIAKLIEESVRQCRWAGPAEVSPARYLVSVRFVR